MTSGLTLTDIPLSPGGRLMLDACSLILCLALFFLLKRKFPRLNSSEFTSNRIRQWLKNVEVITAYIEPGSPWENGYCESFNSRMRDNFLKCEIFGNMYEAKVLTKQWVTYYNTIRPHSSLGGRPPAPQTIIPLKAS